MLLPIQSTSAIPGTPSDSGDAGGFSGPEFRKVMDQSLDAGSCPEFGQEFGQFAQAMGSSDESRFNGVSDGTIRQVFPWGQAPAGRTQDDNHSALGDLAWLSLSPDFGFLEIPPTDQGNVDSHSLKLHAAASETEMLESRLGQESALYQVSGLDQESGENPTGTDSPEDGPGPEPTLLTLVPIIILPPAQALPQVEMGSPSGEVANALSEVEMRADKNSEAGSVSGESPSSEEPFVARQVADSPAPEWGQLSQPGATDGIAPDAKPPVRRGDSPRLAGNPETSSLALDPLGNENPQLRVAIVSESAGRLAVSTVVGESPAEAFALRIVPSESGSGTASASSRTAAETSGAGPETNPVGPRADSPAFKFGSSDADGRQAFGGQSGSETPGSSRQRPPAATEAPNRQSESHPFDGERGPRPNETAALHGANPEKSPTVSVRGATHEASLAPARDESVVAAPWSNPWGSRVWESARLDSTPGRVQVPMRGIDLRLPVDNQHVDVQLRERAGVLDISVRSADPVLAREMQSGVGDLIRNLESRGFDVIPRGSHGGSEGGSDRRGLEEAMPVIGRDAAPEAGTGFDGSEANPREHASHGDSSAGQGRQQGRQRRQRNPPADPFRIEGFSNNRFSIDGPASGAGPIRAFEGGSTR